jgi:hypothetical protein
MYVNETTKTHSTKNAKHSTNNKKHSKYKYAYYQYTHTLQNPHIRTLTHFKMHTLQNKLQPQYKIHTNEIVRLIKYPQYKVTVIYMALLSPRI